MRAQNQKAAESSFSAATNGRTQQSSNIQIFHKIQNLAGFFCHLWNFFPSILMPVSCNSKLEVSLSNVHVCTCVAHVMSIILRRVRCTIRVPGPMGYAHVKGGTALFVGQGSRPCSHKPNQKAIHIFHQL